MTRSTSIDPGTQALIAAVRGRPAAMVNIAITLLLPKGLRTEAKALCEEALTLDPDDPEIGALVRQMRSGGVGRWYFTMVQDHGRHALYAEAFRRVFPQGATVLDIGAGTGLFAMLAAREGAARVVGCERDISVAAAAQTIVEANGYADRVVIVPKDALDLQLGVDLDERADVLLWDNLANNLIGAGAIPTVEDARSRLVKPGAAIMPCRAEIIVALMTSRRPEDYRMGVVDTFDMTAFNTLSGSHSTIERHDMEIRSTAATLFDINFSGTMPIRGARGEVTVRATKGIVHGIAQWVRFHLGGGIVYETNGHDVHAFGIEGMMIEPIAVEDGQEVTICGAHDRSFPWFWLKKVP